ncbi:MAG: hypothetical protein DWP92_06970 [Armatimonadetes bacterium]|nr:MAG: hypothetical protein DWP92_06970 [Armatimonadota bacterium]
MSLADAATKTCAAKKHVFAGTGDALCPICRSGYSLASSVARPQSGTAKRRRSLAYGAIALFAIAGVVAVSLFGSRDDRDDSQVAIEPTTTISTSSTTTIAVDAEVLDAHAYELALSNIGTRAERSANRVLEINALWDSRQITQDVASTQLVLQRTETESLVDATKEAAKYGASDTRHDAVEDAAEELNEAVAAVREGLLEPGSRAGRDDATLWTVAAADQLLEVIDSALELDRRRLENKVGSRVPWEALRVGDCVDIEQASESIEIVSCSSEGRGEVLAIAALPASANWSPAMCEKASLPYVDFERLDTTQGSWDVRSGSQESSNQTICTYVPMSSVAQLVIGNVSHVGPFVSTQWDALENLGLAPERMVEVGECFVIPPDDEPELVSTRNRVGCDVPYDFSLSAVVAMAPSGGAAAVDRINLKSWGICADSMSTVLPDEPYLIADADVYPTFPGLGDEATPMFTLACAFQAR